MIYNLRVYSFILLLIFNLSFLNLSDYNLPDYDSYERIFYSSGLGGDWEIFYVYINYILRSFGFSYIQFRNIIMLFDTIVLWLLIKKYSPKIVIDFNILYLIELLIFFIVLFCFYFEFFIIRIRAGLSLSFIFAGLLFQKPEGGTFRNLLIYLFLFLAFFTHMFTTSILIVILVIPFFISNRKITLQSRNKNLTYLLIGFIIIFFITSFYLTRGVHMISPLNYFRFLFISIIPIFIYVIEKYYLNKYLIASNLSYKHFTKEFNSLYFFLSIYLIVLFLFGFTNESGEAIVRVFTLSSIPSLLSYIISGITVRSILAVYLLACNGLFFIYTVFSYLLK